MKGIVLATEWACRTAARVSARLCAADCAAAKAINRNRRREGDRC